MNLPFMVIGAGGHAAVVADALIAAGAEVLGFTDASASRRGATVCGLPVVGDDQALEAYSPENVRLVNGIGGIGNRDADGVRRRVQERLAARGWIFAGVRHPSSIVSPRARIGLDAQLLAGCVVQVNASVGVGCIVNTAAVVEHDVVLGMWCHVAPGAVLCGAATLGAACHVGAGAVIRQGVTLGAGTIVGAGAVVVGDHAGGIVLGSPARRREIELP